MQTVKCILFQEHECDRYDARNENLLFHIAGLFRDLRMDGFTVFADICKGWYMNLKKH